jgi:hypothetical protein
MKLKLAGIALLVAGCSSTGATDRSGADAQVAMEFCAGVGQCNSESSCASGVCCDGRDCISDCVAVAQRFRADVMAQLEGCLVSCGDEEACVFAVEEANDDRPIDTAFEEACTAALACGDGYPELCAATGLFTETVLRAAMDCLSQDCDRRDRCLANATICHPNSPNDFCF